ncbi:AAA family ATPase [uncultured Ligilactobacillus sp.]|uniref:AAA family ATPase n=1 Tax=uncultured Ligilactobacillus sp. TaxID=2837633 RepID=UPI00259BAC6C|nr:AAA family ATPase [uncultured Ligilactobacillus sp.]
MTVRKVGKGLLSYKKLQEAIDQAEPGDVLEFKEGYCIEGEDVVIDKNLSLKGKTKTDVNGQTLLTNEIHGSITVKGGAEVELDSLSLYGKLAHDSALSISEKSTVKLFNSVVAEEQEEKAGKVLIWVNGSRLDVSRSRLRSDNSNVVSVRNSAETIISDSIVIGDKLPAFCVEKSRLTTNGTEMTCAGSDVIYAKDSSELALTGGKITGNGNSPAVWIEKSSLTTNGTEMTCAGSKVIYAKDSSELALTGGKITGDKSQAVYVEQSKADIGDAELVCMNSNVISVHDSSEVTITRGKIACDGNSPAVWIGKSSLTANGAEMTCASANVISVHDSSEVTITRGKVTGDGDYPAVWIGKSSLTANGTEMTCASSNVIYAKDSSELTLTGGKITGDKFSAVCIERSSAEISDSEVTCAGSNVIVAEDSSELTIYDSSVVGNKDPAVFISRSKVEIVGTEVKSEEASSVYIENSIEASISKSRISSLGEYALHCNHSDVTIRGNEIKSDDSHWGVYISRGRIESENDELSSASFDDVYAMLHDTVVRENFMALKSPVRIIGEVRIMGEKGRKSDALRIGDHSSVYGDRIVIGDGARTELKAESILEVSSLEESGGGSADVVKDATCTSGVSEGISSGKSSSGEGCEPGSALEQLHNLIGLKSVKKKIDEMCKMVQFNKRRVENGQKPLNQSLHSVFYGNPGTGKTTVARLMGQVLCDAGVFDKDKFKFVEVSEADLVAEYIGQTAPKTTEVLKKATGGILFIDEAYTLNKKKSLGANFGQEAIDTILKYMEDHRSEIMIVFAGYTKEMEQFLKTNPGLKSRVPNEFDFEDYTPEEAVEIGLNGLESQQCRLEDEEYYATQLKNAYRNSLDKSNGRWVRGFNEKLVKSVASRIISTNDLDADTDLIKNVDIQEVLKQNSYQEQDGDEDAYEKLQRLVGIESVKKKVDEFISLAELNHRREEMGQQTGGFSLHSLFIGNPGTGKTTVARIVARILYQKGIIGSSKCIETTRDDFVAGYTGQTAIKTKEVLESALGGVLFIDEAYTLKNGANDSFGQEAIDTILKFMEDHRKDIVIIFAGYSKEMEDFLKTNSGLKSRVPNKFMFEDYSEDEIVRIGLLDLNGRGYSVDEDHYADVIGKCYDRAFDHSNGRWIRNLDEKIITAMASRVSGTDDDISTISNEDVDSVLDAESASEDVRICPECHKGNLIRKKGKYGEFIGCTNFPECKYTESCGK